MESQLSSATEAPATTATEQAPYDSILMVSFGGPEHPDHVIPFLENVLRGKPVPRERLLEVAEHYYHFGGISPINQHCRELIAAVQPLLTAAGCTLPVYWGNRNWDPLLTDTVRAMRDAGHRRAATFVTSAFSCYSGCRQYRENCYAACDAAGPDAPKIEKIRVFFNHPLFIEANVDRVRDALAKLPEGERAAAHIAFTAHSIPMSMARTSRYVEQLEESCRLVAEAVGVPAAQYKLVYQSRSGRPEDPWLEPDISDHLRSLHAQGVRATVIAPIGFLSDHMEIMYDLDEVAAEDCKTLGMSMARAGTVGLHPAFVRMVADLIVERVTSAPVKPAIGRFPANHDVCPVDCCPAPVRPQRPAGPPGAPGATRPA
jgi:protoporphyrin/coproporphyrin ferrochelatase